MNFSPAFQEQQKLPESVASALQWNTAALRTEVIHTVAHNPLNKLMRIIPIDHPLSSERLSPREAIEAGIKDLSQQAQSIYAMVDPKKQTAKTTQQLELVKLLLACIVELRTIDTARFEQVKAYRYLCRSDSDKEKQISFALRTLRGSTDADHIEAIVAHLEYFAKTNSLFVTDAWADTAATIARNRIAPRVVPLLTPESNPRVVEFISTVLAGYRDTDYQRALAEGVVAGKSLYVKQAFADALVPVCDRETAESLLRQAHDSPYFEVHLACAVAIQKHFPDFTVDTVLKCSKVETVDDLRHAAIRYCNTIKDPRLLPVLHSALSDRDEGNFAAAISSIWHAPTILCHLLNIVYCDSQFDDRRNSAVAALAFVDAPLILERVKSEGFGTAVLKLFGLMILDQTPMTDAHQFLVDVLESPRKLDEDDLIRIAQTLSASESQRCYRALVTLSQTSSSVKVRNAALRAALISPLGPTPDLLDNFEDLPYDGVTLSTCCSIAARFSDEHSLRLLIDLYDMSRTSLECEPVEALSAIIGTRNESILNQLLFTHANYDNSLEEYNSYRHALSCVRLVGLTSPCKLTFLETLRSSTNVPFRLEAIQALHGTLTWHEASELYELLGSIEEKLKAPLAQLLFTLDEPAMNARLIRDGYKKEV